MNSCGARQAAAATAATTTCYVLFTCGKSIYDMNVILLIKHTYFSPPAECGDGGGGGSGFEFYIIVTLHQDYNLSLLAFFFSISFF